MKYKVFSIVLFCMLFISFSANAINFDAEETYNSVVVVYTDTGVGSGFAIEENLLLTNAHVVEDNKTVTINLYNDSPIKGTVIKIDNNKDLALIQTKKSLPVLDINKEKISIGDEVYAIGAPKDMPYTMTKGIISALDRQIGKNSYIQLDASVNSGNSGGPLLDSNGKVIGVITLKASDAEGIGFAIPVSDMLAFIDGVETLPENTPEDSPENPTVPSEDSEFTVPDTKPATQKNETLIITIIILSLLFVVSVLVILKLIFKKQKKDDNIFDFEIEIEEPNETELDFEIDIEE